MRADDISRHRKSRRVLVFSPPFGTSCMLVATQKTGIVSLGYFEADQGSGPRENSLILQNR